MWLGCVKSHGTFSSAADALSESCNSYFFDLAEGIGFEGLWRAYERVGWKPVNGSNGSAGPAYQDEIPGIADTSDPVLKANGQILQQQAIGYGVNVSPVYVARAYAALATGILPQLRLFTGGEPASGVSLGVHENDLELVQQGLGLVVTTGTAKSVPLLAELGVRGKTGTAEISAQGHNNAWFAGYLPRRHPEAPILAFAAVAYFVPDNTHGGDVAAQMIATLLQLMGEDEELARRYLRPREGQQ